VTTPADEPSARLLSRGCTLLLALYLLLLPWQAAHKTAFVALLTLLAVHLAHAVLIRSSPLPGGCLRAPLLLLTAGALVSGALSGNPVGGVREGIEVFLGPLVIYAVTLRHVFVGRRDSEAARRWLRHIGAPVCLGLALSCGWGFLRMATGKDGAAVDGRFHGGYYWYAEAARYLEIAGFLVGGAAGALLVSGRRKEGTALLALTALAFTALVLTRTKGAYLGTAAGVLALALVSRPRWILLAVAAGALITVLVPGPRSELAHLSQLSRILDSSVDAPLRYRPQGWRFVLERRAESPLLGHGPGGKAMRERMIADGFTVARLGDPPLISHIGEERAATTPIVDHAHNTLLQIFWEMGALGVLAFCWLFFRFYRGVSRGGDRLPPFLRILRLGSLAAATAVLIHGLVAHVYADETFNLLFCGLALADLDEGGEGTPGPAGQPLGDGGPVR
jgi:O-antigen ligase